MLNVRTVKWEIHTSNLEMVVAYMYLFPGTEELHLGISSFRSGLVPLTAFLGACTTLKVLSFSNTKIEKPNAELDGTAAQTKVDTAQLELSPINLTQLEELAITSISSPQFLDHLFKHSLPVRLKRLSIEETSRPDIMEELLAFGAPSIIHLVIDPYDC
ncbi:hypothetical protein FB451DRAFT_1363886, partial [Mycena latifolia]